MLVLPFIILQAKADLNLTGWQVGMLISVQMLGSIAGHLWLWKRFVKNYQRMIQVSLGLLLVMVALSIVANAFWLYGLVFFLFGLAYDGQTIANMNLIIELSPEDKRPVFVAIQNTLSSFGLFFPLLGGWLLNLLGYFPLALLAMGLLMMSFYLSRQLQLGASL